MAGRSPGLGRLLSPRSIAFIGGAIAEMAIERSLELGYDGDIWPVHPTRDSLGGRPCFPTIDDLPAPPDAVFIGIRRDLTIAAVRQLSQSGAGGCVCYAAGFAEMGTEEGRAFQGQLIEAAGAMPLIGPNCFGFVNHLDDCALWPYLFGGQHVEHGVALISQSGNIAMNLTMNQRSVAFTHVIGTGNQAVLGAGDYIDALLEDDRVRAIGMYLEGLDDLERFSHAALKALDKGVPLVVMKVGKTEAGAAQASSHTSSLTGSDQLYDALFERIGVVRVNSLNRLLETLKIFDAAPPLAGRSIVSLSCSGGEAAIMADKVRDFDLETPPFNSAQVADFATQFANYVTVSNPFDYNTSIWGDGPAMERCYTTAMQGTHDAALLIYDHPTIKASAVDEWVAALDGFIAAHKATGMPAFVVCTISELLPADMRRYLLENGVVPLQGLDDALSALSAAAWYQAKRRAGASSTRLPRFARGDAPGSRPTKLLDEAESKERLRAFGLAVPDGAVVLAEEAAAAAERIGYPVVVKAVGTAFAHKSDLGAVALNLDSADAVRAAVENISSAVARNQGAVDRFLVERMVEGALAELIIGVKRDAQFGPALVIGAGGVLVELIEDSVSLLLPTDPVQIEAALDSLKTAKLLKGYRSKPPADKAALVEAVLAVAAFAEAEWDRLEELDVNPLLVLPAGQGVVAADALIRLAIS